MSKEPRPLPGLLLTSLLVPRLRTHVSRNKLTVSQTPHIFANQEMFLPGNQSLLPPPRPGLPPRPGVPAQPSKTTVTSLNDTVNVLEILNLAT